MPPALLGPLKYVGIGLASILFLFFMTRALRRREQEDLPMPTWLTEIEGPRRWPSSSAHERRARRVAVGAGAGRGGRSRVDNLVQEQPERVAQQLRAWISEDPNERAGDARP